MHEIPALPLTECLILYPLTIISCFFPCSSSSCDLQQANEATLRRLHRELAMDEQKKIDKKMREKEQLARMTRENDALLVYNNNFLFLLHFIIHFTCLSHISYVPR